MSHYGSETCSEGQAGTCVYLNLIYTLEAVLNRVFDSNNMAPFAIKAINRSIKSGGFAGAGWTTDENNAKGAPQHLLILCQVIG